MRIVVAGLLLVLSMPGCVPGNYVRWRDERTLEVGVGPNKYVYRLTALRDVPPTERAIPVVSVPPDGAEEVGLIAVSVEYSGWGAGGLRPTQADFYEDLAQAAARLGGTHFHVANEGREHNWVTSLTVSVLRVPN